jgi:hypothetical protein
MLTASTRGTFDISLGLYTGAACGGATEASCSDNDLMGSAANESITVAVSAGDTVWFWVTGYDDANEGPFSITFDLP